MRQASCSIKNSFEPPTQSVTFTFNKQVAPGTTNTDIPNLTFRGESYPHKNVCMHEL